MRQSAFRLNKRMIVLADEGDDNIFFLQMRSVCLFRGLTRLDLESFADAEPHTIVLWTPHARAFSARHPRLAETALAQSLLLLVRAHTPIDPSVAALRRLEWTNAADVLWQWRVAIGVPAELVNRPQH